MSVSVMKHERLVELLVQRATEGLSANEQAELQRLQGQERYADSEQFEQTAAALLLGSSLEDEPLPFGLKARLLEQADRFAATSTRPSAIDGTPLHEQRERRASTSRVAWFAAAASAVLAIAGWWSRLQELGGTDVTAPTLWEQRDRLRADASVLQRDWQATDDPAARGVTGDVVWDPQTQMGYMRFRGLPSNDPRQLQYQLWIFDATRGDQYPVDGGVFDIPANQEEILVPIQARLPVRAATLFAVTIEKPGGVVVSSRERIVVLAQASG